MLKKMCFIRPGHLLLLLSSSSDAHVPIVGALGSGRVSMGTLTSLQLCSPICNKLWCTVYSDTFLSEPALTSSAIWATVARLLDRTTRASLRFPRASMSLGHEPVASSPLFLLWTTFDRYWPLQTRNTPQELQLWRCLDPVVWPFFLANLALVKLAQILTVAYFSCF